MNYEKSEDEKIRKELISFIKRRNRSGCDYDYDKWIAWLEKQGEKKSSDEVLKIRQEVYQSGYNDGYKHGIEDAEKGEKKPDTFIDKAADKFKQLMYDQHFFEGMVYQDAIIENLVGYFKTYMKGE